MSYSFNLKHLLSAFTVTVLLLFTVAQTSQAVTEHQDVTNLTGQVLDAANDEPLSDAEITITETGQTAASDSFGSFEISEIEPGTYTIEVDREGYEGHSEEIEITEEGTTVEIDLLPS